MRFIILYGRTYRNRGIRAWGLSISVMWPGHTVLTVCLSTLPRTMVYLFKVGSCKDPVIAVPDRTHTQTITIIDGKGISCLGNSTKTGVCYSRPRRQWPPGNSHMIQKCKQTSKKQQNKQKPQLPSTFTHLKPRSASIRRSLPKANSTVKPAVEELHPC